MNDNEDLFDKLDENYLNPEQLDFLLNLFAETADPMLNRLNSSGIILDNAFKEELIFNWTAWEIRDSDIYHEYVRLMLIPADFIYQVRDYFISTIP